MVHKPPFLPELSRKVDTSNLEDIGKEQSLPKKKTEGADQNQVFQDYTFARRETPKRE